MEIFLRRVASSLRGWGSNVQRVRNRSVEVRERGKHMLIVTTIYCMELETAKKLSTEQPTEEQAVNLPGDDREFLGIYQGKKGVKPNEQ